MKLRQVRTLVCCHLQLIKVVTTYKNTLCTTKFLTSVLVQRQAKLTAALWSYTGTQEHHYGKLLSCAYLAHFVQQYFINYPWHVSLWQVITHSIHNSTILSDICGGKAEQSIYIYMCLVYFWRHFFRGQPPIINQEDVVNNWHPFLMNLQTNLIIFFFSA